MWELYYINDFILGRANHIHHACSSKDRQIWLLLRLLGHPSFGCLKHLFSDLFSNLKHWSLHDILALQPKVIEFLSFELE